MNVYELVVFVSWIAALWGVISASIQQNSAFESIGRTKWKWVVINVLGIIIPYLGLVTAGTYGLLVFRNLPTRSRKIRQGFNPASSQSPGGYDRQPSSPAPETGFTVNASKPAGQNGIPCSACGTSGRVSNDQACFPCGGRGYV